MMRSLCFACIFAAVAAVASAQTTRGEFLFGLQSSLKAHNVNALKECFNFEGATPELVAGMQRNIEEMATWPSPHVFTTERVEEGAFVFQKDGKNFTLNGDWTFQVHIHRGPPPSKGFVFPAGRTSSGKYRILLAVEK